MENMTDIENMEFREALHLLMHQEKLSRNEKDIEGHKRVLEEILNLCIQHGEWQALGESIQLILGKHLCVESSAKKLIRGTVENLDKIPNKNVRCKLIATIRSVCDGKFYLEREHSEVTQLLADLHEKDGKFTEAAQVLNELKIEAYGLLNQREKVDFILQQMRLLIKSDQQEKASILSKKIQLKFFNEPENEDLKIKFYDMKIELERGTSYLETSKHYHALSACRSLSEELKTKMIVNSAIFCALAQKCPNQVAFIAVLLKDEGVTKELAVFELLKLLSSKELIPLEAVQNAYEAALDRTKVMKPKTRFAKKCFSDLNLRIIEHNILTISKYYSKIELARMAELIGSSVRDCEENVAQLVNSGLLRARIDRFTGTVDFSVICIHECLLNSWFDTMSRIMSSANIASHHIQREFAITHGGCYSKLEAN